MQNNLSEILNEHEMFGVLPDSVISKILENSVIIEYEANTLIFSKGALANSVFVILEGEVAIEVLSINGRITNIANLLPVELLGEFTVLDNGRRSADARALVASKMLSISKPHFLKLIETYPQISITLIRNLIQRLRDTNSLVESISLLSLRIRIALMLVQIARHKDKAETITIHITQTQLADRVSASREKVNGHLQWLQDVGAIHLRRGEIDVINMELLNNIACSS